MEESNAVFPRLHDSLFFLLRLDTRKSDFEFPEKMLRESYRASLITFFVLHDPRPPYNHYRNLNMSLKRVSAAAVFFVFPTFLAGSFGRTGPLSSGPKNNCLNSSPTLPGRKKWKSSSEKVLNRVHPSGPALLARKPVKPEEAVVPGVVEVAAVAPGAAVEEEAAPGAAVEEEVLENHRKFQR